MASPRPPSALLPWGALAVCLAVTVCLSAPGVSGYDPLDPTGNITILWDIPNFTGDGYKVNVKVYNYQFYRKVNNWKLSWTFWNGEYIWDATVRALNALAQYAVHAQEYGVVCCKTVQYSTAGTVRDTANQ